VLAAALIRAQTPGPAPEPPWWQPQTELRLRADRITDPDLAEVERASAQLRLRWEGALPGSGGLRYTLGLRSALGSDGNRWNLRRWDQQPSNGAQADAAHLGFEARSERAFGDLRLGFQDLRLLVPEALWDRDLRFLGLGLRAGLRDREGRMPEAGIRLAAGRVRTVQGGDPAFLAVQAVLKVDTGPVSWSAHGGRWELAWDRGFARIQPVPGHEAEPRQRLRLDAYGASATWNGRLPAEVRAFGQRHRESGERSTEIQALVGSLARPFWPRLSVTWQRLSRAGTLYPLNGDEWWYYWNARGHRLECALPLPDRWFVSLVYLRQQDRGEALPAERRMVTVTRRFPLD
jgi:hypothetical protein